MIFDITIITSALFDNYTFTTYISEVVVKSHVFLKTSRTRVMKALYYLILIVIVEWRVLKAQRFRAGDPNLQYDDQDDINEVIGLSGQKPSVDALGYSKGDSVNRIVHTVKTGAEARIKTQDDQMEPESELELELEPEKATIMNGVERAGVEVILDSKIGSYKNSDGVQGDSKKTSTEEQIPVADQVDVDTVMEIAHADVGIDSAGYLQTGTETEIESKRGSIETEMKARIEFQADVENETGTGTGTVNENETVPTSRFSVELTDVNDIGVDSTVTIDSEIEVEQETSPTPGSGSGPGSRIAGVGFHPQRDPSAIDGGVGTVNEAEAEAEAEADSVTDPRTLSAMDRLSSIMAQELGSVVNQKIMDNMHNGEGSSGGDSDHQNRMGDTTQSGQKSDMKQQERQLERVTSFSLPRSVARPVERTLKVSS